jgi:hypothetical protein
MDSLNFTIPVKQLRGLCVRRGITPGAWCYPGSYGTTYSCAVSRLSDLAIARVRGERIGSHLPPAPGCTYSYERALACRLY